MAAKKKSAAKKSAKTPAKSKKKAASAKKKTASKAAKGTAGKTPAHNYTDDSVQSLSSLEHIRLRTGMYIGRVGDGAYYDDGIYVLLKEVIDNGIDEHIMGFGKQIEITLDGDEVRIRDFGRGIPHGKLVDCVQFSVGLNGVGTKAVNALATHFTVVSYRDGAFAEASFEQGQLLSEDKGKAKGEPDGTLVCFTPDPEIFKDYKYKEDHIRRRLKFYTYLNAGLTVVYNGKRIRARNGLLDLIADEIEAEGVYPPLHYQSKMIEFAFTHANLYSETYFSFVNDVREGLVGAVAIRLKDPVFESQTKNKLGNSEIRSELVTEMKQQMLDLLHRNPKAAERAVAKIEETQKMRKEISQVKKLARERSRSSKTAKSTTTRRKAKGSTRPSSSPRASPPPVR